MTRPGIVCALASERRTLAAAAIELDVRTSGVGPERAERAARELVAAGADHLVSWGFAGGLSPALESGHLVVATTLLSLATDDGEPTESTPTPALVELVQGRVAALDPSLGRLVSTSAVVADPAHKARLHARTNALCVDMESAAVGAVAAAAGLPWASVRAVVDDAGTAIPPSARVAIDAHGHTAWRALLRALARRPRELAALARLGRRARRAERALGAAAAALFAAPWD